MMYAVFSIMLCVCVRACVRACVCVCVCVCDAVALVFWLCLFIVGIDGYVVLQHVRRSID